MFRILTTLVVLLAASTAMAGWGHYHGGVVAVPVAPAPMVTYYAPPAPVVTYYAPACPCESAPVVSAAPVMTAVPMMTASPVIVGGPVGYVPGRYSVRFYPYGQPVRNVVRAVLP